jgi:hypothetical protein
MKKPWQNWKLMVVLLVGVLVLSYFASSPPEQTLVSLSNVYVDPQGSSVVSDELRGGYWILNAVVNKFDKYAGVIVLDKGTEGTITWEGVQKSISTGAKIEIKIIPEQAYLIRRLTEKTIPVTQEAGQTYANKILMADRGVDYGKAHVDGLNLNYYDWDEGEASFRQYSQFTVSVYKDGAKIGSTTWDSEKSSTTQTVPTSEGTIVIENLGNLLGDNLTPNVPSHIMMVPAHIYDYNQVYNKLRYDVGGVYTTNPYNPTFSTTTSSNTFSTYWYGIWRETSTKNPVAFSGWGLQEYNLQTNKAWVDVDEGNYYRRNPVAPTADNVNSWLYTQGVENLLNTVLATGGTFEKMEIVEDNGYLHLKISIPYGTYATPQITIRVPTELADTWVDQPSMLNAVPHATWKSNGEKHIQILNSEILEVNVENKDNFEGSTTVRIVSPEGRLGVDPVKQIVTLGPKETKTITFKVNNLGTTTQISGVPIHVTCSETYTSQKTGEDTVTCDLLPNLTPGITYLNVKAFEKDTENQIGDLQVSVSFGGSHLDVTTDDKKPVTIQLATLSGGAYVGQVTAKSYETAEYEVGEATINIPSAGVYDIVLQVPVKGVQYTEWYWWLIVAVVAVGVVGASVGFLTGRKGKSKR